MANLIKIKRSSATATPASLSEGELAVSFLSGKLFVGNSSAVIPIGGIHSPGVLTANQALVANATSGIDKIIVSNAVITSIWANGAAGAAGQTLTSNSTGGIYWAAPVTSLAGLTDVTLTSTTNNDILVYDQTAGKWENHTISGNTGQVNATFVSQNLQISLEPTVNVATAINVGANVNLTTSAINVGNSTVNAVVNSTSLAIGTTIVNTAAVTVGSNVSITTSVLSIGNSTVNTAANSTSIQVGTTVVNGDVVQVGSNVYANSSALFVGNSTVNTQIYAGNVRLNGSELFIGNSTSNIILTGVSASFPNTTINGFANVTGSFQVGSNTTVINDTLSIGNSTVNTSINSTSISTSLYSAGNTTITGFINVSSTANIGGDISARANLVVNGALTVANTAALGNTTITGFANVVGDFTAHGNVALGNSFGVDVVSFVATVNTEITPSANNTQKLGRADLRWGEVNANNVLATNVAINTVMTVGSNLSVNTSALFIGNSTVNATLTQSSLTINNGTITAGNGSFQDMSVSGNLTVSGTLTTINTTNLTIQDPLIKLANNNSADLVDLGFYGMYTSGGTKYTAFFRDQSDSGKYKLYVGLTNEPGTTVDLTGGTLAALSVGAVDASSLSLTTALAVGSGGTGLNTVTTNGILYGNTTGPLGVTAAGTEGKVFQAGVGGVPLFADLDGGTF